MVYWALAASPTLPPRPTTSPNSSPASNPVWPLWWVSSGFRSGGNIQCCWVRNELRICYWQFAQISKTKLFTLEIIFIIHITAHECTILELRSIYITLHRKVLSRQRHAVFCAHLSLCPGQNFGYIFLILLFRTSRFSGRVVRAHQGGPNNVQLGVLGQTCGVIFPFDHFDIASSQKVFDYVGVMSLSFIRPKQRGVVWVCFL